MVEVRDRDTIIATPATDGGAGAAAMVLMALVIVAVIGYMIYAFNGNSNTVIEHDTNTIQQPAPSLPQPAAPNININPAPSTPSAAPAAPSAPSAEPSGDSSSNQ